MVNSFSSAPLQFNGPPEPHHHGEQLRHPSIHWHFQCLSRWRQNPLHPLSNPDKLCPLPWLRQHRCLHHGIHLQHPGGSCADPTPHDVGYKLLTGGSCSQRLADDAGLRTLCPPVLLLVRGSLGTGKKQQTVGLFLPVLRQLQRHHSYHFHLDMRRSVCVPLPMRSAVDGRSRRW